MGDRSVMPFIQKTYDTRKWQELSFRRLSEPSGQSPRLLEERHDQIGEFHG